MTADVATPKSQRSRTAMAHATASPDGRTDGVPTPFYDRLMSMIDATAQENTPAVWNDGVDGTPPVAGHRWSIPYPIACAAGFVVALAAGGAIMALQVGQKEPPVVAAADAPEAASRVVASAATADAPAGRLLPAAGPDGQGPLGVEGRQAGDGGLVTGATSAAKSDAPPADSSVPGRPTESVAPDLETPRADPPDARASAEAKETEPSAPAVDATAEPPLPADPSWATALAPAVEKTGPEANQGNAPAAGHMARIVSGVNMRAGPSNSQAVVATIPRGSRVEVIDCRQWCEVIFTGQRGWVYKSFIDPSPGPGGR